MHAQRSIGSSVTSDMRVGGSGPDLIFLEHAASPIVQYPTEWAGRVISVKAALVINRCICQHDEYQNFLISKWKAP
jgi:hypothetical protein